MPPPAVHLRAQIQIRVSDLVLLGSENAASQGRLLAGRDLPPDRSALYVSAWLSERGEARGQAARTTWAEASASGAVWGEWLQLTTKVRSRAAPFAAPATRAVGRSLLGPPRRGSAAWKDTGAAIPDSNERQQL